MANLEGHMYKRLYSAFYYDTFRYHLFSPKQTIVNQIDDLFTLKRGLFKGPNLNGRFVEYPDKFYITPKWAFEYIRNFETKPAYLKGAITEKNNNETIIEISVRPNSVYLILFVFFLPISLYWLYKAAITKNLITLLSGLWLIFCLPLLFFFAKNASNKLRKSFESYMNMTPEGN